MGRFNDSGDYLAGPEHWLTGEELDLTRAMARERYEKYVNIPRRGPGDACADSEYLARQHQGAVAEWFLQAQLPGSAANANEAGTWDIFFRGQRIEVKAKNPKARNLVAWENDVAKSADYWFALMVDMSQALVVCVGYVSQLELFDASNRFSWYDPKTGVNRGAQKVPYSRLIPYGKGPLFN